MIDLHTHTTFSDGELIPAEAARRARVAGYTAMAFTDHVDLSNIDLVLDNIAPLAAQYSAHAGIDLFCGVEVTHVPPPLIADTICLARDNGAQLVVVHGETITEPVARGTNLAAIQGGADILAHPGLITGEEVRLAAELGVHLEITTRKGHNAANGHVAALAVKHGAKLVINNDAHAPSDWVSKEFRKKIALGAGLTEEQYQQAEHNSRQLVRDMIQALTGC